LVAIEPGAELLDALAQLSAAGPVWIDGAGQLEGVELLVTGDTADAARALPGRFTLLHLVGPSGGPFSATLARASGAGIEVLGGVLVRARSAGVTIAVHPTAVHPTAVHPTRGAAEGRFAATETPLRARNEAAELSSFSRSPASGGPPLPVWARAAAASAAAAARAALEGVDDGPGPEAGDLVEHFAFGLCEVLTSDGDRLRIRDLKQPGRVREVSMTMLKVMSPTESDGKRMFRLARRSPA
jgi:hypothetical protein